QQVVVPTLAQHQHGLAPGGGFGPVEATKAGAGGGKGLGLASPRLPVQAGPDVDLAFHGATPAIKASPSSEPGRYRPPIAIATMPTAQTAVRPSRRRSPPRCR